MNQHISIITLGVKNLALSREFYSQKLGWKISERSNDNIVFFDMGGVLLSLYGKNELAKDAQVDPGGEGFKCFTLAINLGSEKEVDDYIRTLEKEGVVIIKPPQKVFWGGYSSYFADPDYHLWEVAYNPFM